MATVALGDQQIQIQDFNGFKFLEATDILSRILDVVPEVDAAFTEYAKHWLAENGRESVLDRAAAIFTYGDRAKEIPDEVWEANDNKLRLPQAPPRNEALIRALPAAYRKARPDVEKLVCLLATPNSKIEEDEDNGLTGDAVYKKGGSVFATRKLVIHRAKFSQQMTLLMACVRQLAEELRESDFPTQASDLRTAIESLVKALNPEAESSDEQTDDETSVAAATSGEPSSSTPSSPPTPAASPGETSSTGSPIAS